MEGAARDGADKSWALKNRFRGCLVGLACGDAVGTTVEFRPRGSFQPLTDMVGGGPFGLKPGQWTDDTSMALCLAESLLERGDFDPGDQMRRYVRWWREGYLSPTGTCFDIGNTVAGALARFERTGNPWAGSTDLYTAGNGSIMRLAPVVLFHYPDLQAAVHWAGESSRTTHGAQECIDACRLLAAILCRALDGATKEEILRAGVGREAEELLQIASERVAAIARGDYLHKQRSDIAGTGYVVASLEAALYCFAATDSFEEAILMAANLGDDADTTAAVCGQIAGAHYGLQGIPDRWIQRLAMAEKIQSLADALMDANGVQAFPDVPFPRSYWVLPRKLLAGAYPGSPNPREAEAKLKGLLECGIRRIINLMEPHEVDHQGHPFNPYDKPWHRLAAERGLQVSTIRYPIRDVDVPSVERMKEILDDIDRSLKDGRPVYVHCWGGRGRTGTVVGCYLVRTGWGGNEALRRIERLRAGLPDASLPSPETPEQIAMVRDWAGVETGRSE